MKKLLFALCLAAFVEAEQVPRLLIKIPTRSRPEQFLHHLDLYYQKLSGTIDYHFLITCNNDDSSMNNEQMLQRLQAYPNLTIRFADCKNKIDAYNRHIDEFKDRFDILLVASDDMVPVKQGYDKIIANYMLQYFPDYDGTLHFFDGHVSQATNTMPIIGKKYYERFGYIYYPGYQSMYCDNEFTLVAKILKKEKYLNELIIEHLAPAWGKAPLDDLYRANNAETFHTPDSELFAIRQTRFFDLDIVALEQQDSKLWSILICTLPDRHEHFTYLYQKLEQQIASCNLQDKIEIRHFLDNYEYSIGYKRNELLTQAQGTYVNFIDDDDDIRDDYISAIYNKLLETPDLLYFKMLEQEKVYFYPIRRVIAVQFPFPDQNFNQLEWIRNVINSNLIKKIDKTKYRCYVVAPVRHKPLQPYLKSFVTITDQFQLNTFYQSACSTLALLHQTFNLATWCIKNNIPGDFVECGILKGAFAATMAWASGRAQTARTIHLFDPLTGIDTIPSACFFQPKEPNEFQLLSIKQNVPLDKSSNNIMFHFGPYQDTVPQAADSIAAIAFLRLHTNTYENTLVCLEQLYPKISNGGFIIIDNYLFYDECQQAVTEFLTQHDYHPLIKPVQGGNGAVYWPVTT